jgi:hypothetical protein
MKTFAFLFVSLLFVTETIYAQNVIKIQIDHGGLHCPYLGPRLKNQFTELASVDSVKIDKATSIATLYMIDGQDIPDAEIADIIVHKVGFPRPEIKAISRHED